MRKAITPIIAIIVLLLITVALAGAAWTFLQGFIFPQITKSFLIPAGGAYCSGARIKVFILNTGYQSDLDAKMSVDGGDFILFQIDGTELKSTDLKDNGVTVNQGESKMVLDYDCNETTSPENACDGVKGYHNLDIGTISSVQHLNVFCP